MRDIFEAFNQHVSEREITGKYNNNKFKPLCYAILSVARLIIYDADVKNIDILQKKIASGGSRKSKKSKSKKKRLSKKSKSKKSKNIL